MSNACNPYLLGDATDAVNWGDADLTKGGTWAPLELVVAPRYRADFMFMGTVNARIAGAVFSVGTRVEIHLYKHSCTRQYVNVDKMGRLYEWAGDDGYREVSLQEARRRFVSGLARAVESGVDIGQDMRAGYDHLTELAGLPVRGSDGQ